MKLLGPLLLLAAAASAAPVPVVPLAAEQLHVKIAGPEAAPPLVLIHGLDSAAATFNPVIPTLAESFRVIAYDQRGHGKSAAPGDYSLEAMAADLAALFDREGLESAHVLGHSFGARTALKFAELHPGRVRSLVIEDMETVARPVAPEAETNALAAELAKLPREFESKDAAREALARFFSARVDGMVGRGWTKPNGRFELFFRPDVSVLYGRAAASADLTAAFAGLGAPVLILKSEHGSAISETGLAELRRARPDAELVPIPGSTHNVHGSRTEAFLDAVLPFLRRVAGPPAPAAEAPPEPAG